MAVWSVWVSLLPFLIVFLLPFLVAACSAPRLSTLSLLLLQSMTLKVQSCKDPLVEMGCPACDNETRLHMGTACDSDSCDSFGVTKIFSNCAHCSKGKRCTATKITSFHAFQHRDTAQHYRCCLNDLNDLADDQESLLVLSVSMTLQVESQSPHGKKLAGRMVPTHPEDTIHLIWSMMEHGFEWFGVPSLATQKSSALGLCLACCSGAKSYNWAISDSYCCWLVQYFNFSNPKRLVSRSVHSDRLTIR